MHCNLFEFLSRSPLALSPIHRQYMLDTWSGHVRDYSEDGSSMSRPWGEGVPNKWRALREEFPKGFRTTPDGIANNSRSAPERFLSFPEGYLLFPEQVPNKHLDFANNWYDFPNNFRINTLFLRTTAVISQTNCPDENFLTVYADLSFA